MNNIGHPENANPEEDSMTFQEKLNLVNLGVILIIFIGYCVFLFQMIQSWDINHHQRSDFLGWRYSEADPHSDRCKYPRHDRVQYHPDDYRHR